MLTTPRPTTKQTAHPMSYQGQQEQAPDTAVAYDAFGSPPGDEPRARGIYARHGAWDPNQQWTDPYNAYGKREFLPHVFISDLIRSPQGQAYQDVTGAATLGVEGVRAGEASNINQSRQEAASMGLGRGYAQQMGSNIRQEGTQAASQMLLQADLESRARAYEMAQMMTQALIESNKTRVANYWQEKTIKAAKDAGDSAMLGGIIEGGLGLVGNVVGGLAAGGVFS